MSDKEQLGPIDFVVVEFPGNQFNGEILPALADLIAAGTVRILDLAFVGKDDDGTVVMGEIEDLDGLGALAGLGQFISEVVTEEDLTEIAGELEAGSSAAVLVWENTWAVPFINAVKGSNGDVVASGRLAATDVLDALAAAGAEN